MPAIPNPWGTHAPQPNQAEQHANQKVGIHAYRTVGTDSGTDCGTPFRAISQIHTQATAVRPRNAHAPACSPGSPELSKSYMDMASK